ncbi:hypothetical protein Daus18300_011396 [Diaporthe australafricana]|uniref:F-box domain-containing protein n=1 Tax=Diaporthe australafricana TaxID=127596 RepID=A0ABR3W6R6_9PEZI
MAPTLSTDPCFHPFPRLPLELKFAIIEEFLRSIPYSLEWTHNYREPSWNRSVRNFRIGGYATINRLWQFLVEKSTFYSLQLSDKDLNDFQRICVGDRIKAVSAIQLRICLDNCGPRHTGPWSSKCPIISENAQGTAANGNINTIIEIKRRVVFAEIFATAVFGHFFRILEGWHRDRGPICFSYDFFRGYPRLYPVSVPEGTHLRIDSSSFPEVTCIGSLTTPAKFKWGIEPRSMFRMLARLPNVKDCTIALDDELGSPEITERIREGHAIITSRPSKVKALWVESTAMWRRRTVPELYAPPSLQLSQAIFDLTLRLEELYLFHVVDVPHFLRRAWDVSPSTSQGLTTWPNLKIFCISGYLRESLPRKSTWDTQLFDPLTSALSRMPKLVRLDVELTHPFCFAGEGRIRWMDSMVYMEIPPRDAMSPRRDGMLMLNAVLPTKETLAEWQDIAQRQWGCRLREGPNGPFI